MVPIYWWKNASASASTGSYPYRISASTTWEFQDERLELPVNWTGIVPPKEKKKMSKWLAKKIKYRT